VIKARRIFSEFFPLEEKSVASNEGIDESSKAMYESFWIGLDS
jgi:hypothetical protein